MTDELYHSVSVNTEMTGITIWPGMKNFAAALSWGTLAGTLPITGSVLLEFWTDQPAGTFLLGITLIAGLFVSIITLAMMLLAGLPVTWLLHKTQMEHVEVYAVLGAIAGFAVPIIFFYAQADLHHDNYLISLAGALAGFASALRWSLWRRNLEQSRRNELESRASKKTTNPIHDLLF